MNNNSSETILTQLDSLAPALRKSAIGEGEIYQAGNVSKWNMFVAGIYTLWVDLPLLLWRSWMDTKARYKRSVLGPYWLTIGTLTFVAGYSVLAGLLFNRPLEEFLGYIACGVVAWQFISLNLTEGSKVFVSNATEIRSVRTNLINLPVRLLLRSLIALLHSVPIVMVVVFFTDSINLNTLFFIPGLILLSLTLLPVAAALGTLASRYRDIEQLVTMLMQFAFYMTPLLWKAELLGEGAGKWIALANPFYYALTIVRNPLLGLPVPGEIWLGAIGVTLIANILGYAIFIRFRQRIPFWI